MRRWCVPVVLVVLVFFGIFVRAQGVVLPTLRYDELITWRFISGTWSELFDKVARDNHPPLYFVLLKAWVIFFGSSHVGLRSLGLTCAMVTTFGLYALTRSLVRHWCSRSVPVSPNSGQLAGVVASALFVINPFQIFFSAEARMYPLGVALAVTSSLLLLHALDPTRGSPRRWAVYGLSAVLFLYTHYYALFTVTGQLGFACGMLVFRDRVAPGPSTRWANLRLLGITAIGIGLAWLPWLATFLRQLAQVRAEYWTRPMTAWSIPVLCFELFIPYGSTVHQDEALIAVTACLLILLGVAWRAGNGQVFLLLLILWPVFAIAVLSWIGIQVFNNRYFLFTHVFLLAAVGLVLERLPSPWARGLAVALVGINSLGIHLAYPYSWERLDCPGERGAAAFIDAERRINEPAVCSSFDVYLSVVYYSQHRKDWFLHYGSPIAHYYGVSAVNPTDWIDEAGLEKLTAQRVWVVANTGPLQSDLPIPRTWVLCRQCTFPCRPIREAEILVREYTTGRNPLLLERGAEE